MKKLVTIFLALCVAAPLCAKEAKEGKEVKKRTRILQGEGKVVKGGSDSTVVDFDEVSISGERRNPMGSLVNQNKADKDYDFVKIRRDWKSEIFLSTHNLR